jgi:hypothetical protein
LEIIALLIGLVILAAIGFYVSRPLARPRRAGQPNGVVDVQSLEAQRESLYTQIKELDLDHATGKVNEDDYTGLRAELVTQAAEVLKQIDGVAPQPAPAAPLAQDDVEALIAARRKTRTASMPRTAEADVEAAIAARRKTPTPLAGALACPTCGKPVNTDDAFCAKCGTALRTQATT